MRHQLNFIILLSASVFFLFSCNREQPSKQAAAERELVCYQSVSNGDTAWLSLDTTEKVIRGELTVNYAGKRQIYDGKFTGQMLGDTVKGYYDFKINKEDPSFRNPMAFLKRDNKLTMGIGKFEMVVGTAHFDKKVPIDYEKGRFIFDIVECRAIK